MFKIKKNDYDIHKKTLFIIFMMIILYDLFNNIK